MILLRHCNRPGLHHRIYHPNGNHQHPVKSHMPSWQPSRVLMLGMGGVVAVVVVVLTQKKIGKGMITIFRVPEVGMMKIIHVITNWKPSTCTTGLFLLEDFIPEIPFRQVRKNLLTKC
jgi:hypothetical protein